MGGLVGGIYDLFSGDPTKREEGQLAGVSNYQTGLGEGLATAGAGEEEAILSGDPSRIAQVEAPEISAQQGQIQGQALQNANFGNRSGGTNASTQAAQAKGRGNIIDLTGNLIGQTAGAAVGQGGGFLDSASKNLGAEADLAAANRQRTVGDINDIASTAADVALPFLTGGGGGGGGPQPWAPPGYLQASGNAIGLQSDNELGTTPDESQGWNTAGDQQFSPLTNYQSEPFYNEISPVQ